MQRLNGAVAFFIAAALEITSIELVVVLLGDSPEMAAGPHRHVDDAAGPDVDGAGIEFLVGVFFRGDVGGGAAQARDHVGISLPGHAEALAVTKVGNLERTASGQEEVLGLQVSVGDTHLVEVLDTTHHLLEEAVGLLDLQLADTANGWELKTDGGFERRYPAEGEELLDSQALLLTEGF